MPKMESNVIGAPPRYPGKLLKTGQITQYASELDDGYYEIGLTKRYLILTTGQYSGVCTFTLDGLTETQSHNCVRDLLTGLMWARYTSAESASVGPSANGRLVWTGTEADIYAYCAAANAAELGGYSDWRIPNLIELLSLLVFESDPPFPDTTAFPTWDNVDMWVSTMDPEASIEGLAIDWDYFGLWGVLLTSTRCCILVRGSV